MEVPCERRSVQRRCSDCVSAWLSFVTGMVGLYYPTDQDVQQDAELQAWIRDVTQEGFTQLPNFGQFLLQKQQAAQQAKPQFHICCFDGYSNKAGGTKIFSEM